MDPKVVEICTVALISRCSGQRSASDVIMYQSPLQALLVYATTNADKSLVFCASFVKLGFDFLVNECFVVLEVLLNMNLEFDDVVQDLFDFCVQFLAQSVGAKRELFESRRAVSVLCLLVAAEERG